MTAPIPHRQIRAVYDERTIRMYQAYSDDIADSALARGTFVSPPFSMQRMTWIKPSFLWMMYRAGWGNKDENQKRILAIDITREGFEWALRHSCPSTPSSDMDRPTWESFKRAHPVRIQWDPERDLQLRPLDYRAIQIGISGEAVRRYVDNWIQRITDITSTAQRIHNMVELNRLNEAQSLLPLEKPFEFRDDIYV